MVSFKSHNKFLLINSRVLRTDQPAPAQPAPAPAPAQPAPEPDLITKLRNNIPVSMNQTESSYEIIISTNTNISSVNNTITKLLSGLNKEAIAIQNTITDNITDTTKIKTAIETFYNNKINPIKSKIIEIIDAFNTGKGKRQIENQSIFNSLNQNIMEPINSLIDTLSTIPETPRKIITNLANVINKIRTLPEYNYNTTSEIQQFSAIFSSYNSNLNTVNIIINGATTVFDYKIVINYIISILNSLQTSIDNVPTNITNQTNNDIAVNTTLYALLNNALTGIST
jgi:hypothetical protein